MAKVPNKTAAPAARRAPKAAAPVALRKPASQAAAPVIPVADAAVRSKEADTMEDTVKNAAAKAESLFAEFNDFAKGNVEAVVESSKIAAKGFEAFGRDAADYGRKSFDGATAALRQAAAAKSPADLFKLQSDYVRSAFDALVAETSKNTESLLKLAGDIAQPLSNRAAIAVEKIKLAA